MRTFLLNKLIRDKLLPDMERLGQQVIYRRLDDADYIRELTNKLLEEAKEFKPKEGGAPKELADILEVVEHLAQELGLNFDALRALQLQRRQERGGFDDRIFVEQVSTPDGDSWADYYAKDPVKYPEITKQSGA